MKMLLVSRIIFKLPVSRRTPQYISALKKASTFVKPPHSLSIGPSAYPFPVFTDGDRLLLEVLN